MSKTTFLPVTAVLNYIHSIIFNLFSGTLARNSPVETNQQNVRIHLSFLYSVDYSRFIFRRHGSKC